MPEDSTSFKILKSSVAKEKGGMRIADDLFTPVPGTLATLGTIFAVCKRRVALRKTITPYMFLTIRAPNLIVISDIDGSRVNLADRYMVWRMRNYDANEPLNSVLEFYSWGKLQEHWSVRMEKSILRSLSRLQSRMDTGIIKATTTESEGLQDGGEEG
jgi:hypothetical protein